MQRRTNGPRQRRFHSVPVESSTVKALADLLRSHDVAPSDNTGALDDALQLPDIAGPGVFLQPAQNLGINSLDRTAQFVVEAFDKVPDEQWDVLAPLAKCRETN